MLTPSDRIAEFNLLMLGRVLRVFRLKGHAQVSELKKLLEFVENVPEHFAIEAKAVLKEFENENGAWHFAGHESGEEQIPGKKILKQLRARI